MKSLIAAVIAGLFAVSAFVSRTPAGSSAGKTLNKP